MLYTTIFLLVAATVLMADPHFKKDEETNRVCFHFYFFTKTFKIQLWKVKKETPSQNS